MTKPTSRKQSLKKDYSSGQNQCFFMRTWKSLSRLEVSLSDLKLRWANRNAGGLSCDGLCYNLRHHNNHPITPMSFEPPWTQLLYSKIGVSMGINIHDILLLL